MRKINPGPQLVFIVEDNSFYSLILKKKLESIPALTIETFSSGEDCLGAIHRKPTLVVMDYNLSGMDGLTALKEIKSRSYDTKVIFVSAQKDLKVAIELFGAGASDFISKDLDTMEVLTRAVERNLEENLNLKQA